MYKCIYVCVCIFIYTVCICVYTVWYVHVYMSNKELLSVWRWAWSRGGSKGERGRERSGKQSQVSVWQSWHPVTNHSLPLNAVAGWTSAGGGMRNTLESNTRGGEQESRRIAQDARAMFGPRVCSIVFDGLRQWSSIGGPRATSGLPASYLWLPNCYSFIMSFGWVSTCWVTHCSECNF